MSEAYTERPMPTGEGLTFEKVWAMFQETDRKMQETDRQIGKTEQLVKDLCRQMGGLHNSFGELVEHLVAPSILEKFNDAGFFFTKEHTGTKIKEPSNPNVLVEIDILLENGDIVIAVEVKSKPNYSDIEDLKTKMEVLRREADRHGDTRKYRGALAGAIMSQELCKQILKNGFYLIEQTGDTVMLTIPEGFTPRDW